MDKKRDWIVLLIGGPSGTGKSSIAYGLAAYYGISVLEIDDIGQALKAVTNINILPDIHYWGTGINWKDIGAAGNVDWLIGVSKELAPSIKAIVNNHLESGVPVIIEGDFLSPELAASFDNPMVKSIFINEADKSQIVNNYLNREGGSPQGFRAEISIAYGIWLSGECKRLKIPVLESRPWSTAQGRAIEFLL